ncbi:MAG TPA: hypothetical protein VNI81_06630 [Candidatus Limnocylindrales bacterium]|nr:hypothetical protein [Candidatus Limnocylindrales bacterium]
MDTTKPPIFSGDLREIYNRELNEIREGGLLKQLWSGDVTLWPPLHAGSEHFRTNLEFRHLPDKLPEIAEVVLRAETLARAEGLTDRVLIAFENSHHLCEALLNICTPPTPLNWMIMHSSHPSVIRRIESQIELKKTLFVLVNKSGYRVGDHSLFLHFQRAIETIGSVPSSRHFVTETEPNSFLATIAKQYGFRFILDLPPVIPALYCSLVDITALLVAVAGVEPEVIRAVCRELKTTFLAPTPGEHNAVCELAAFLSATVMRGRTFLIFLAPRNLAPFATSLCQLVGGSLGKGESGLYPVTEVGQSRAEVYAGKASVVFLRQPEENEPFMDQTASELRNRGIPFLEIKVRDPLDLLRETFLWQIGTVLASARTGADPFDVAEPRLPRLLTAEMLNNYSDRNDTLKRRPRIQEGAFNCLPKPARARIFPSLI